MKALAIYGPPGTGKTTELMALIAQFIEDGYNPQKIAFVSHTKAAAAEALSRLNLARSDKVSTIHSQCYRLLQLGSSQLVNFRRLEEFSQLINVPIKNGEVESEEGIEVGDEYLGILNKARNRMVDPVEEYMDSDHPGSLPQYKSFIEGYHDWKKANGYIDFTDMLERFVRFGNKIEFDAKVLLVDEAQDLSPLQWSVVRILARNVEHVVIAGDDDQCQPVGTLVETQFGAVPIEALNPSVHKVRAYSPRGGVVLKNFKVGSRAYAGPLVVVRAGGFESKYTPDHTCVARFNVSDDAVDGTRVVYLMRKGNKFRVGETKAFTKNKITNGVMFYPKARMRQEKADGLWVLDVCYSGLESRRLEQLYSLKYGIPTTIFDYSGLRLKNEANAGLLEFIHSKLDVAASAQQLLRDLGMSIDHPLWVTKVGGQKTFETKAMNLIPGFMQLGIYESGAKSPAWVDFTKSEVPYEGKVYSLAVDDYRTYFADRILTHNCLYLWGGADPMGMRIFEEEYNAERKILTQSHRIPGLVHTLALGVIERIHDRVHKEYYPRAEKGIVKRFGYMGALDLVHGDDVLLLARSGVQKKAFEKYMLANKIPYSMEGGKPGLYQSKISSAIRTYEKFRQGQPLNVSELELLQSQALPKYREAIRGHDFVEFLRVGYMKTLNIPSWSYDFYASTDVTVSPTIRISTIHGSKGRESDRVVVDTGMTQRILSGLDKDPDSEARVFYVAVTRAKQRLDILDGENAYDI